MINAPLLHHPGACPLAMCSIDVSMWRDGARWHFRYRLKGTSKLILPAPAERGRADELWRTTCFEAFVSDGSQAYSEYNFSPSGQWAAYAFDRRREGMRNAPETAEVRLEAGADWITIEAAILGVFEAGQRLGLSAVIEEEGGRKSYWALAHPDGPPDFHDPSCFVARVPE